MQLLIIYYYLGLYHIPLFRIQLEPDLVKFINLNPAGTTAGSGFGDNLFWDHRIIHLMKTNGVDNC